MKLIITDAESGETDNVTVECREDGALEVRTEIAPSTASEMFEEFTDPGALRNLADFFERLDDGPTYTGDLDPGERPGPNGETGHLGEDVDAADFETEHE